MHRLTAPAVGILPEILYVLMWNLETQSTAAVQESKHFQTSVCFGRVRAMALEH